MPPPETEAFRRLYPETITARIPGERRTASPSARKDARRAIWRRRHIVRPGLRDRDFLQGNRNFAKYDHRECGHGRSEKLADAPRSCRGCRRHRPQGEWDISCRFALTSARLAAPDNSAGPSNSAGNDRPLCSITICFPGNRVREPKVWFPQGTVRRLRKCAIMMISRDELPGWMW